MKHSGWYPDYVTRLYRNCKARVTDDQVHERIVPNGPVGTLNGILRHYTDPTIEQYFRKMVPYAKVSAEQLHAGGRTANLLDLLCRPPALFFKMYLLKLGFLDSWQGFVLAVFSSFHVFTKYSHLYHLSKSVNPET